MSGFKYIPLQDLEVYQLARKLSAEAWSIHNALNYEIKKLMGDQFLRAMDSVGANIAEGYSRYHYLEKIRFYHIARASLVEACYHWAQLMHEREVLNTETFNRINSMYRTLEIKLNNMIKAIRKSMQP